MARQLWLLRHADAEPHGTRLDAARRLTERGEEQARAAGAALALMNASFESMLFSPKVRARQTAEIAVEAWDAHERDKLEELERLGAGFSARDALAVMEGTRPDGRVLVVGHEPDLSNVIAALTGASVDLKKGGLAIVRLEGAAAELLLLMRPRELALIAGVPLGGH